MSLFRASLLTLSLWPVLALAAPGAVVTTPQVRAELVAHAPDGVAAGKPLWLALKIDHQPHWHTYWKNPGDSGLPTTLQWTLPAGVVAGSIQWPTPGRLPIGPLMNYGYEGTLLLPVAVAVPAGFNAETLAVKLRAEWLVCKDVCIPESGDFELQLPAQAATAGHAALFEATRAALPRPVAGVQGSAVVDGQALVVRVAGLPATWQGRTLGFLPETAGVIHNAAVPTSSWKDGVWTARVALDPQRSESPSAMPVVLTSAGQPAGLQVQVAVTTPWPAAAPPPAPLPALGDAQVVAPPTSPPAADLSLSLGLALVLALAGGALLNLMPCVFPVLSLKVLGFAAHAHDRRGLLAGGLAYTAGVVLSFVALAALLLALRAGGEQLGWGFQLQSPAVVAALAALFTLIGLNLAGVFEFGSVLPSGACAPPGGRFLPDWRAGRSGGLPLHRAFHGRVIGRGGGAAFRSRSGGVCGTGPGHGAALSAGQRMAGGGAVAAPAGRVDGALQDGYGLPDVCHRRLARLGAGRAGGCGRRGGTARAAGDVGLRRLGAGFARAGAARAQRFWCCGGSVGAGRAGVDRARTAPGSRRPRAGGRRGLAALVA